MWIPDRHHQWSWKPRGCRDTLVLVSTLRVVGLQTWGKRLSGCLKRGWFVLAACEAQVAGGKDRPRLSSLSEKTLRQAETPNLSRGRILFQNEERGPPKELSPVMGLQLPKDPKQVTKVPAEATQNSNSKIQKEQPSTQWCNATALACSSSLKGK